MSDDQHFSTTLAYTKSPKASKRTSFQDELQRAVSARVSRQPALKEAEYSDYSDEFEESDDDDILNNIFNKKATNERLKKTISKDFLLSDDEEEKPHKVSFLKSKKIVDSNVGHEWEHNHNENKAPHIQDGRPEGGEHTSTFFSEHQQVNKSIMHDEVDAKPAPIPKPRDYKSRVSPTEGIILSASDESFTPTPRQRSVLKRSNIADNIRTDEKSFSNKSSSSVSALSSLTRLNEKVLENRALVENFSPEGHWLSSPPPPTPKSRPGRLSPAEDSPGGSKLTLSPERTFMITKENEHDDTSKPKDNGRKSPSVLELMMSTVYEQSKQQLIEAPHLESNECEAQTPFKSKPRVEQEYHDYSEQEARQNKSEQHRKAIEERNLKNKEEPVDKGNSPSTSRCLNTSQSTKKSSSAKSAYNEAKSRYLGTLTVLDNKKLLKDSSDFEAADALRAAVYQDWLEKKRIFLQELQKIKKTEEEKEREKRRMEGGAKKEEAIASFQAWKAVKTKELKKNLIKLKEEEEKKRKELEQMAEKKEESKKAAFEKWREDKEERLKEKVRKEKLAELAKKQKEQQTVAEKKKESMLAFSKWAERKEDVLKSKKKEKLQEKEKQDREKAEKEGQEKKAMEIYERWLDKKERRDKIVKKQKKLQVILEDEPIPPWSPPGRTVPMGK